jgi:signal transduction histidine kinase
MVVHELHSWNAAPAEAAERQKLRIDALRQELEDLGVMLRRVAHRLHPALIEQAGLIPALQQLGNDVSRASGLRVDVVVPENGNAPYIPRDQSLIVYRIAQEALRNIVKHASVDRATMQVTVDKRSLTMLINDAGRGFDSNAANANARGLGLISMAERARLAEGQFEIQSQPGQGTAVRVTIALRGQSS